VVAGRRSPRSELLLRPNPPLCGESVTRNLGGFIRSSQHDGVFVLIGGCDGESESGAGGSEAAERVVCGCASACG
jgi:hypothetical protein